GTGVSDQQFEQKVAVVRRALEVNRPDPADALGVLAAVGGFEIGGIAGVIIGAAAGGVPVVLDGFISGAGALIGARLAPGCVPYMFAAHRSVEVGHTVALNLLGLEPLLELDLRLGEGTGAALAMSLIEAAAKVLAEMATFAEAGVSESDEQAHTPQPA
ncbi:MAG: nicotinate-nucleotide--dimethylbenzimidazole phosphoribosyltransferase, partial [Chloroflexota bacterium]